MGPHTGNALELMGARMKLGREAAQHSAVQEQKSSILGSAHRADCEPQCYLRGVTQAPDINTGRKHILEESTSTVV